MMMGCNGFLYRLCKVVPQMPAVGDFDRIRRSGTGCFGICAGTVAADHFGAWMCSYPFSDGIGLPISEYIPLQPVFAQMKRHTYRTRRLGWFPIAASASVRS